MDVDIRSNLDEVRRRLGIFGRRQLPFAISLAVNEVLSHVKSDLETHLRHVIDRPAPFTMRALGIRRSTKRRLEGAVFVKDIQAGYLRWLQEGGTRRPRGQALVIPVTRALNRYGNMPRGAVARDLARSDTFATEPGDRLPGGIYRRLRTGGLRLLVSFKARARYTKAPLRYRETARRTALRVMPDAFARAVRRALDTAR